MEEQIKSEQDTNINEKVTKKSINPFSLIAIATVIGIVGSIAILVFFVWGEIDKYTINIIPQEQEEVDKHEENYQDAEDVAGIDYIFPYNKIEWLNYHARADSGLFYHINKDEKIRIIETPFDLKKYNSINTKLGHVFYSKGEMRDYPWRDAEGIPTGQTFKYESGIQPEIYLFTYNDEEWHKLPILEFSIEDNLFEKIYNVYASISENKILFEIGIYDTKSTAFEPGLVSPLPISARGIIYDLQNNKYIEDNTLEVYLEALGINLTLWHGMIWDSARAFAVAGIYGEGCGSFGILHFVNLDTGEKITVDGNKNFDFSEDDICSPKHSISPEGDWFILYGPIADGRMSGYLFNYDNAPNPVREIKDLPIEGPKYFNVEDWNLDGEYPIVTFSNGSILDFNE